MVQCNANSPKANDPEYLCNPKTGRYVKKSGKIGQQILQESQVTVKSRTASPKSPPKSKQKTKNKEVELTYKQLQAECKKLRTDEYYHGKCTLKKDELTEVVKNYSSKQIIITHDRISSSV